MLPDRKRQKTLHWALLAGYAALLLSLLSVRPLWLDELMEVVGSFGLPLTHVISGYAAHSAGQSPLGAVEQALSMRLFGFSTFTARLPAALASLLGCAGMFVLARRAGLRQPWIAFVLLASFPLVMRYGSEDRPYSQAMCLAIWLTVAFLLARAFLIYAALLIAGLYTQPYVLFAAAAHAALLAYRRCWPSLVRLCGAILLSLSFYLPWYLHSRPFWREEVELAQLHFHLQAKLALLIPRELTGTGYLGTAVLLLLAGYGLPVLRERALWIWSVSLPLLSVVLADLEFDYFFAIRQVIFVLPPLAVMSAAGLERLWTQKTRSLAIAAGALVFGLNIGYSIRWFTKPGENWPAAAAFLAQHIETDACFVALPTGSSAYYEFFQPALKDRECKWSDRMAARTVAVAISPYLTDLPGQTRWRSRLEAAGLELKQTTEGQPRIQLYSR